MPQAAADDRGAIVERQSCIEHFAWRRLPIETGCRGKLPADSDPVLRSSSVFEQSSASGVPVAVVAGSMLYSQRRATSRSSNGSRSVADDLVVFVSLAGDQDAIARFGFGQGPTGWPRPGPDSTSTSAAA